MTQIEFWNILGSFRNRYIFWTFWNWGTVGGSKSWQSNQIGYLPVDIDSIQNTFSIQTLHPTKIKRKYKLDFELTEISHSSHSQTIYQWWFTGSKLYYHQTSNINCVSVGNKIVDHSDVVGALPVGAAPITPSFSTYLASMDWPKATARRDNNHLRFGIWCAYIRDVMVILIS